MPREPETARLLHKNLIATRGDRGQRQPLAHPLGARFGIAHGLVCALCLPACLAFNHPAIKGDMDDLKRRHGIDVEAQADAWLTAMRLPNAFKGKTLADRDAVIRETLSSGSTAANPRPVTAADVRALLDDIFTQRSV